MVINIRKHGIIVSMIMFGAILIVTIGSLSKINTKNNIWIETESPLNNLNGFLIIESDEMSGGKGIKSNATSHNIGNFAEYNFNTNISAKYNIWARMYGSNACGNSFYVSVNNLKRNLYGNDDLLKRWHWVKGPEIELSVGKQKVFIWNEEWGTEIDRILITSDLFYVPNSFGESSDFNINFTDDIPEIININSEGYWGLKKIKSVKTISPVCSDKGINYFTITKNLPENFYLKSRFYFKDSLSLLYLFNFKNKDNFKYFEIDKNSISLFNVINAHTNLVSGHSINITGILGPDTLNSFSILNEKDKKVILLNGYELVNIENYDLNMGLMGFGSKSQDIYISDILLKSNMAPLLNSTFFEGLKGNWEVMDGEWKCTTSMLFNLTGLQTHKNKPAKIICGEEYWKNYYYSAVIDFINIVPQTSAGIIFNFQNIGNYYLFRWENNNNNGILKLIKVDNNVPKVIQSLPGKLDSRNFYKFEVKTLDDFIYTYIDDKLIFSTEDTSHSYGKVGLYSEGIGQEINFDDIDVQPTPLYPDSVKVSNYSFNNRLGISMDLSEWENSKDFLSQSLNYIFNPKRLFETQNFVLKKRFNDEIEFSINASAIPADVDIEVNMNSIINNKNISVILLYDKIILKSGTNTWIYKDSTLTSRDLFIVSYIESGQRLIVKTLNKEIINTKLSDRLMSYQAGVGFTGIGAWNAIIPQMTVKTNSFYTKPF